jgi:DNA-binding response OmpR family regulator
MASDVNGPARIVVVDDEPSITDAVATALGYEGFEVAQVHDGRDALEVVGDLRPDLVVLDIMLPGLDGLEVCRRLRSRVPIPVVMLTARGSEEDRVLGLDLGADDYVSKPFSPRELTARVKAVLRRAGSPLGVLDRAGAVEYGGLQIDLNAREARVRGELAALTAREFELLAFLAQRPRQVFRRDELLEHVWGYTYGDTSTVTVHIRRLREKIEDDPSVPRRITTVWGVGYRFDP